MDDTNSKLLKDELRAEKENSVKQFETEKKEYKP